MTGDSEKNYILWRIIMTTIVEEDQERKDILELDELSDAALKHNFGYGDAGIENLRSNAKAIRAGEI